MKTLKTLVFMTLMTAAGAALAGNYYVAPDGNDSDKGSKRKPFKTIAKALEAAKGEEKATISIRKGTYYLDKPLIVSPEHSGLTIEAYKKDDVIISGGSKLSLEWKPYKNGIMQAETDKGINIDQLFVNDKRQHMARYPNHDPNSKKPYNGCAGDAFSKERAAKWADPAGGYIHALHSRHWGGFHYLITGKKENNEITYEGGWQNNRQMGMHKRDRMVENIFEELDAPGEWYHNSKTDTLYYYPAKDTDISKATIKVADINHLIELQGSKKDPVKNVEIKGLIFRHCKRTFMETKEPLLRSDWTVYRGGTVFINGAEDCLIEDCEFDQIGGNGVFVNNYNRRIAIKGSYFHDIGASAVLFVGDPKSVRNPLFEYKQRQHYKNIDKTAGPKGDNYPADCVVEDCLIHTVSVVEKQATGVQMSMSKGITVRHCSIYDTGRAGINISEGTFGGHLIDWCDVFDTVRETGDHGSFNSWGRDRFWGLNGAPEAELPDLAGLDTEKTIIRNSRWRCDRGWDIDLDDGSSHYEIYNNLMLNGGLKLREGFHREVYNNITINDGLHPHVWYPNSHDKIYNNIWLKAARPVGMRNKKWGIEVDRNMFISQKAKDKNAGYKVEQNSIVGDPMFVDPSKCDYTVKPDSPALKMGFKNFPMDKFGVQKKELKKIARVPIFPEPWKAEVTVATQGGAEVWKGATIKELKDWEFSAFGVAQDDGGIHLVKVPKESAAGRAGLKTGDVVQSINSKATKTIGGLFKVMQSNKGKELAIKYVRAQSEHTLKIKQ